MRLPLRGRQLVVEDLPGLDLQKRAVDALRLILKAALEVNDLRPSLLRLLTSGPRGGLSRAAPR